NDLVDRLWLLPIQLYPGKTEVTPIGSSSFASPFALFMNTYDAINDIIGSEILIQRSGCGNLCFWSNIIGSGIHIFTNKTGNKNERNEKLTIHVMGLSVT